MKGQAQNCEVNFPGIATIYYSSGCGNAVIQNLSLGTSTYLGNSDSFVFDLPAVTISGNVIVNAQGSGSIKVPAGALVTIEGNMQFDGKNGGCTNGNACTLTIHVDGTLHVAGNLQGNIKNIVWTGSGTVVVDGNFQNSGNGCMRCDVAMCPSFDVEFSDCSDNGGGCSGTNFCTVVAACPNDVVAPVMSGCPTNQVVTLSAGSCSRSVTWSAPIAVDNCTLRTLESTHSPGSGFPKGVTTVKYTAKDARGNVSICSFTITVVDAIPPSITGCPSNITLNAGGSCGAVATWVPPSFSDNCTGGSMTASKLPGSTFSKGVTPVTYTATDAAGNSMTCTFTVTVLDNSPPVISGCPGTISVTSDASCQAVVNWTSPVMSDGCAGGTLTSNKAPGSVFPLGVTPVKYTATDEAGNTTTCTFNVEVVDEVAPVFTACPANKTVISDASCGAIVTWDDPVVSDCSTIELQRSHNAGDSFPFGKTEITYTANDANNNTSSCSFFITVENSSAPVIEGCPTTITLAADESGYVIAEWVEPVVRTTCGAGFLAASHTSGSRFPVGSHRITYTASDELGKKMLCEFDVVVTPDLPEIEVARIITPDGDDINDFLDIRNMQHYPDNRVLIVDRWGGEIFRADRYNNESIRWHGESQHGKEVPTGTYFYSITFTRHGKKETRTGFIELIR